MRSEKILIWGACALAFGASFANTGLVIYTGTSVSHLTGDIARLAIDLSKWRPEVLSEAARVAVAAAGFFAGAMAAGIVIHRPAFDISRPRGRVITSIGLLFLGAFLCVDSCPVASIALAASGCGLQNALANHFRGVILRTTHLTGMFTDFGITLGMRLRGHAIPSWKIAIPFCVIFSFLLGGISAAFAHLSGFNPTGLASIAYCAAGIALTLKKRRPVAASG